MKKSGKVVLSLVFTSVINNINANAQVLTGDAMHGDTYTKTVKQPYSPLRDSATFVSDTSSFMSDTTLYMQDGRYFFPRLYFNRYPSVSHWSRRYYSGGFGSTIRIGHHSGS